MDWKAMAIEDLKAYDARRQALETLSRRITEIDAALSSIRSSGNMSAVRVKESGSGSKEDVLIDRVARKDELLRELERTKAWVGFVGRALSVLSEDEQLILGRFYVNPAKGNADRLCEELAVEKTALYKRKDAALRKFTLARYGCMEI